MGILFKIKRRVLWQLFSLLPKDMNKVVLTSFYGRGYSDSPRAIAEELLRRKDYNLYWTVKGQAEADSLPQDITPLRLNSAREIYHACTAGFWIDNSRKWSFVCKRGRQFYIQTWHGFPLKRIEKDAGSALPAEYIKSARHDSAMSDLFLSDSRFLSDIYRSGFWYSGEILEEGLPRNDILKNPPAGVEEKVRAALHIPENRRMMLYAPTFRRDCGLDVYDIDYTRCTGALKARFGGDWIILAKLHPNIAAKAGQLNLDGVHVLNASDYPDIHELYIACSAMITDYSSTMFDFMITGKPCFLYVNDVDAYKNDRNFYFDLDRLPFGRAVDNDSLDMLIRTFDQTVQDRRREVFMDDFGIRETGRAAAAAADKMDKIRAERTKA